jgi:hypothetical protein
LPSSSAKVDFPIDPLNKALAEMSEKHTAPRQAAEAFMKAHPDVWKAWLPKDVADKVADRPSIGPHREQAHCDLLRREPACDAFKPSHRQSNDAA